MISLVNSKTPKLSMDKDIPPVPPLKNPKSIIPIRPVLRKIEQSKIIKSVPSVSIPPALLIKPKSPNPIRAALRKHGRPKGNEPMSTPKICYTNTLPDLTLDVKFMKMDHFLNVQRYVKYHTTELEKTYQYPLHVDSVMDLDMDLVIPPESNPRLCSPSKGRNDALEAEQLHPRDAALLEPTEEPLVKLPSGKFDNPRSVNHSKSVPWLKRTEYISTEQTRFQPQYLTQERIEAKIGFGIQKELKESIANNYNDRQSQISAIQKTFEDSTKPITQHFSKPGVVPVEVLPVFPDFESWKYTLAQVSFDSDPSPLGKSMSVEQISQAMIRGVTDESGDQFVAYFLPTDETFQKIQEEKGVTDFDAEKTDYSTYEYDMTREYNWSVKTKESTNIETCFLVWKNDGVYYNALDTRVNLTKRRPQGLLFCQQFKTKLFVHDVPLSIEDYKSQRKRERELEPVMEDDEEEPEEWYFSEGNTQTDNAAEEPEEVVISEDKTQTDNANDREEPEGWTIPSVMKMETDNTSQGQEPDEWNIPEEEMQTENVTEELEFTSDNLVIDDDNDLVIEESCED